MTERASTWTFGQPPNVCKHAAAHAEPTGTIVIALLPSAELGEREGLKLILNVCPACLRRFSLLAKDVGG